MAFFVAGALILPEINPPAPVTESPGKTHY
jgi:hypothetical protein